MIYLLNTTRLLQFIIEKIDRCMYLFFFIFKKFKTKLMEHINSIKKIQDELKLKSNRFTLNWTNSIKSIKKIHE